MCIKQVSTCSNCFLREYAFMSEADSYKRLKKTQLKKLNARAVSCSVVKVINSYIVFLVYRISRIYISIRKIIRTDNLEQCIICEIL